MSEVDWSQFDDWLEEEGAVGSWPFPLDGKELTQEQKQVVKRNIALLLDREAWQEKVDAFEAALEIFEDEEKLELKRDHYCIHFDYYEFSRVENIELNFLDYVFPCSVSFHSVDFGDGDVYFLGSSFREGNVYFNNARFGDGKISFDYSKFGDGDIFFENARFGAGIVSFTSAKFGFGLIDFTYMQFSPDTKFLANNMKVAGTFQFHANTLKSAIFKGMKANNDASFVECDFEECPDFRNTYFARSLEMDAMEIPPPKMKGEKLFYLFSTCSDADDASKYRKLNAMAKAANDHDKDGEFFAYEMMAKRGVEITGFWELLANSFYYHVSYYGQSWIRPLIGMAISCFTFFWIYFIYAMGSLKCLENVWFSIRYSMLNTLPFVSALYRSSIQPKDYESGLMVDLDKLATVNDEMVNGSLGGLMFFSFIQQFIGIVLLFFLLLGLRNRFRLK